MDEQTLWQAALGELELSLSKASFTTWFRSTFIFKREKSSLIVGVPNIFTKTWMENKYHPEIVKILRKLTDDVFLKISYEVTQMKDNKGMVMMEKTEKVITETVQVSRPSTPSLPSVSVAPLRSQPEYSAPYNGVNSKYTFQNFVVGKGNELAKAACMAVARNPGFSYNPLFLYGGVGLGKTHLMQGVANEIVQTNADAKTLYVTCERFTNDFIQSIKEGRAGQFKDTYRSVDVLLIDDIQFLAGKEGTQEEFFHTFNALHQINKQIVISSDRPPKAIPDLENRLISRFEWGMIADVSAPDLETRIAILETKCRDKGLILEKEIVHYIANAIQNNIRELEGALNKLIAHIQLSNMPITLERAKGILYSLTASRPRGALTVKQLLQHVARFFDISLQDITGNSRKKELVTPRQIAIYLMREEIKSSYPSIGQELGGRDHTTAMHAYTKISREIEVDEKIRQDIESIRQLLYTH